ncbi:GSCFA domain-containing protein [Bosea sp. 117]|uniref:GSCFA domain-containing protein n=1 Tax=Bosea sp. 117 TaxID=1125973 RepID=UPI0009DE08ED|nr:GSCFA domain-containing protein [Bosea sp. 117]
MEHGIKQTTDLSQQEVISFNLDSETPKSIGSSFFRGENCNLNPYHKDFIRNDFLKKTLKGWTPDAPVINKSTKITAFGSCFASNIAKHLSGVGYNLTKDRHPDIYISKMGEGLVNIHSLYQQFAWALEDVAPPTGLWHGFKAEEFGYDEDVRKRTREAFLDTDFFIITLGLSEVWYDEVTGGIFWRAVPRQNYDPSRHKFRVCSFAETKAGLEAIYQAIRKHVPNAKLLFTLSPVPLAATFRPVSCITANSASKAILRAALDEFMREHDDERSKNLFYFPSYEIVNDLFFCRFSSDGRHPYDEIIDVIMSSFELFFCETNLTMEELTQKYLQVRKLNGDKSSRVGNLQNTIKVDA